MARLKDVMAYIIQEYPESIAEELSNARLTKLVYLSDWKNCLDGGKPITNINWYFDNHGPYVHDVIDTARENPSLFKITETNNVYGGKKRVLSLVGDKHQVALSASEKSSIRKIIEITRKLYWSDFIKLVYGTYPIVSSERYTGLDLVSKAKEYQKLKLAT